MIPKLIVAVDGMSFHDAEEKGVFSSLSEAMVKGIIWHSPMLMLMRREWRAT